MTDKVPLPWPLIREAFDRALEHPASERRAFVHENYPTDVVEQVTSLLEHHEAAADFLAPAPATLMREEFAGSSTEAPPTADVTGRTLAGRYTIGDLIGQGGTAAVYEASDRISGDTVAVKVAPLDALPRRDLIRHEAAALRLLRLPGIVDLLDMGTDGDVSFLVMRRVHGEPFPGSKGGPRSPWAAIQSATLSLVEALARLHWTGLVHCDLKPSNVLVTEQGNAIILDLGIAQDPDCDADLRQRLALAGTPRYTAPEQLLGQPGTARSDLYAIGVMLYEALAGRDPHDARDATEVICFRPNVPPPPLREVEPDVPDAIASLIDRLIAANPADRPGSAAEVAEALRRAVGEGPGLPTFLGSRQVIEAVAEAARQTTSIDISGARGAGRSSVLREVEKQLLAEGRQVVVTRPSARPFESLAPLLVPPFQVHAEDLAQAEAQVVGFLQDALRAGVVLLVDDAESIDAHSARAIEASRAHGSIVRAFVGPREGSAPVPALTRRDLASFFAGHERIHHIPGDAAGELHQRTAGLPGEVRRELAAWERAGLARREGQAVVIRRPDLERLRSGLRVRAGETPHAATLDGPSMDVLVCIDLLGAHATVSRCAEVLDEAPWKIEAQVVDLTRLGAVTQTPEGRLGVLCPTPGGALWTGERRAALHGRLAAAIPPDDPLKLYHRLMSDDLAPLAAESLDVAHALLLQAKPAQACAVLLESLGAIRRMHLAADEAPHLKLLLRASLSTGTLAPLDRLTHALERSVDVTADMGAAAQVARAAQLALQRDTDRALAALPQLEDPMSDEIRHGALSVRLFLARQLDPLDAQRLIDAATAAVPPTASSNSDALITTARAWLAYATDDFASASRLHEQVARQADTPLSRLSALLNAASAWLEAGDHGKARGLATQAREIVSSRRHAHYEARAERILRAAAYREGGELEADTELTEAMESLGVPHLEALVCLNEAAIAWRGARRVLAQELAARAETIWRRAGNLWPMRLAQALGIAAGQSTPADDIEDLAVHLRECPAPSIGAQAAYLASRAPSKSRAALIALAQEHAEGVAKERWDIRQEITSIREAVQ